MMRRNWSVVTRASTQVLSRTNAGADRSSATTRRYDARLPILDGWRATSILLVLATHLIPIPFKALQLNATAGAMGMSLFFTLSGFLIVRFLAGEMRVTVFATRRLARIVPLAWLAISFLALRDGANARSILANLFFYANLPPAKLLPGGEHLWSICVEMQFYAAVALLCIVPRRLGLYAVPVLCLTVTGVRFSHGAYISIITWERVDEILAGGTLALMYSGWFGAGARMLLSRFSVWSFLVLLIASSSPLTGPLQYLRPYAAAAVVGVSMFNCPPLLSRLLHSRGMTYIASISYALYIIHGVLLHTWLGSGNRLQMYLKRPLLIGVTFLMSHLSTRFFEQPITKLARRFSSQSTPVRPEAAA